MAFEQAAPCRHRGAPADDLVDQVVNLLKTELPNDAQLLQSKGLTPEEYELAFAAAIEKIRGSWAASNGDRRDFAEQVIHHLVESQAIQSYESPRYGDDTIYRLYLDDGTQIGLIQKGCPDGAHSSTNWERPAWADELYLWWLCSSLRYEPGEHIWKGVSRVRSKVAEQSSNQLDGIIFFNQLCGTHERPCPKGVRAKLKNGLELPPPCVYVFPHWVENDVELNWRGEQERRFPVVLLSAFGLSSQASKNYIGYIGMKKSERSVRTEITARFGPAKATTFRG